MSQNYNLTTEEVDKHVVAGIAGVYLLLTFNTDLGLYVVKYVGRSDTDLNERLKDHCSEEYDAFCFEYASTPLEAYRGECRYYHRYGGDRNMLVNKRHPDAPCGLDEVATCPVCYQ